MLSRTFPESEFHWVASSELCQIVSLHPAISRCIPFPRKEISRFRLSAIKSYIRELKAEEYDAVIDFQGLFRSGISAHLARTGRRFGFAAGREFSPRFYSHRIVTPPDMPHAVDKNCFLASEVIRHFTGRGWEGAFPDASLRLPEEWRSKAAERIDALPGDAGSPLIAVGCSSRWESKSWPIDFFAQVITRVRQELPGARIWLLGSPDERERTEALRQASSLPEACNCAGRTDLGTLAAMLEQSTLLLTNDSGPMHIAAAFRTPCVALFSATYSDRTGPWGPPGRHTVLHSACPDAPCFKRQCPFKDGRRCSDGTNPADVAGIIRTIAAGGTN